MALDLIRRAAGLAHEMGAQALELRAIISLASAARGAERVAALETLRQLHGRITEGFGTSDLISAARLLDWTAGQKTDA